jgi:hypothetical protein
MLISLNQQEGLLRNESYEDISEGLVRGCKAEKIQGEKYDWDRLKNFFLKYFLLGPNNLKIFARASVVSQRRGKIMTDTEILTDIRPISLNGHAYGSVILQTLRIEHLDRAVRNDATLQVYFALDGDDLRRLRDQIDGALRTELDLTEMLKGTELYSLTHSSEE